MSSSDEPVPTFLTAFSVDRFPTMNMLFNCVSRATKFGVGNFCVDMRIIFFILFFLCIARQFCFAQTPRYWVATTTPANWNNTANWSTLPGGTGGASIPGTTEIANFTGSGGAHANCTVDVPVTVYALVMSGYTGVVDLQGNNFNVVSPIGTTTLTTGSIVNTGGTASLSITHNNTGTLTFSGTLINVDISGVAGHLFLNGSTFNGTTFLQKGPVVTSTDASIGGNTFNGSTTISCDGGCSGTYPSGTVLVLGDGAKDIFNSSLVLTTNAGSIHLAQNSAGNEFKGNVTIVGASGFYTFGFGTGSSSTLNGQLIVPTGFLGQLTLARFKQVGNITHDFKFRTLSGTSKLTIGPSSEFEGPLLYQGVLLTINGSIFNQSSLFDFGYAGGTLVISNNPEFRGDVSIRYNKSTAGSTVWNQSRFLSGFSYTQVGSTPITSFGSIGQNCSFGGNLYLNTPTSQPLYGNFVGNNVQVISKQTGSAVPQFMGLTLNKTGGSVDLSTAIDVGNGSTSVTSVFNNGIINSGITNVIHFTRNSIASGANTLSHVDGPILKTGNNLFAFPTGNNGFYNPITISAPATSTDQLRAQFFKSSARSIGTSYGPGIVAVSDCEHWNLEQVNGTSNVTISIGWQPPVVCSITNVSQLRVARWNGSAWTNLSSPGGTTGDGVNGGTATSSTTNAFGYIALASSSTANSLPVELLSFEAQRHGQDVLLHWKTADERSNSHFVIERMLPRENSSFIRIDSVPATTSKNLVKQYQYLDVSPGVGKNYYRLRQVDYNGVSKVYEPKLAEIRENIELLVYPNTSPSSATIKINQRGNFTVLNSLGIPLLKLFNVSEFEASLFPSGMYTLISYDNGKAARFLIE